MKRIVILVIGFTLFISSCCKGPYEIAAIQLTYPDITTTSYLKAIRAQNVDDTTSFIDTISLGELNSSNSFSAILDFGDNPINYVIYIENTDYSDTITDITFDRKGCNEHLTNFKYKFNGELRTDRELIIQN